MILLVLIVIFVLIFIIQAKTIQKLRCQLTKEILLNKHLEEIIKREPICLKQKND